VMNSRRFPTPPRASRKKAQSADRPRLLSTAQESPR
jgi:hypothetical protein